MWPRLSVTGLANEQSAEDLHVRDALPVFEFVLDRLRLGLLFCWLAASLTGCSRNEPCGPGTCAGCCDATGECMAGNSVSFCGAGGFACGSCGAGKVCDAVISVCIYPVSMGNGGGAGGGQGVGGGTGGGIFQDCAALMTSQPVSAPCCLAHGIDACGASLFCAAFDGRTQPTCYTERSRLDGESCGDHRHCASGACNTAVGKCQSMPGTACTEPVGCAPDGQQHRYFCNTLLQNPTCRQVGDGSGESACGTAADCKSGVCMQHLCKSALGERCQDDMSCGQGECVLCTAARVRTYRVCSNGQNNVYQCLRKCTGPFENYLEKCWDKAACSSGSDCESGVCLNGSCRAAVGDGCLPGSKCSSGGECFPCAIA